MAQLPAEQSAESEGELPEDIKAWTRDHVRQWLLKENLVDLKVVNTFYEQDICGASLLLLEKSDLQSLHITLGPAKLILKRRDELAKSKKNQAGSHPRLCKPYPFNRFHDAYRYKADSILDVTETGPSNLTEPCHEFKAYINTGESSHEGKMSKFTKEVIKFAAACMNSRTNGTIHFGVGDTPDFIHGQILGVTVDDREGFVKELHHAIEGSFEYKHFEEAKKCIKPPRFVAVLNPNMTSSEKCVIEVDIVPAHTICQTNIYYVFSVDRRKCKKKSKIQDGDKEEQKRKLFLIRDGSSSRNLLAPTSHSKPLEEFNRFVANIRKLAESRETEERKHLTDVKRSVQGSRLGEMITGGSQSLDKSRFERYILVTNKSHEVQLESLEFITELNPTVVLDFDSESSENGLFKYFDEQRRVNIHLPEEYKIVGPVEDIAAKLKLMKNTSWVFCNGCKTTQAPSDLDTWLTEKAASVRDVISFLCRKDVLPQKRFLVVFLLLSSVTDMMDPMLETFSIFWQELRGTQQILCLCENETVFTSWKDLIDTRYRVDISSRSIYELSLAEINGTVLSLWSDNCRSNRFLPCSGGSKVLLKKKQEDCLDTLSILCVNQCEGGSEDKRCLEETFYKGGKVSWWNFYFSEQPGSMPFIKRDGYKSIKKTVIPELLTLRQGCVSLHVLHLPGCGGTTLAMHVLWSLKEKYRCAVLKEGSFDKSSVASQVVQLLTCEVAEQSIPLPVLLMVDGFDEMDSVFDLQWHIDNELAKKDLCSKSPQVILLNCMRAELVEHSALSKNIVFIGNKLSETEQKQFEKKLEEIEKTYKNAETFYGFMIMKKNFLPEYIQGVARNTLKRFDIDRKHAQLISAIFLLNVYCENSSLSVSLCEEFLELETKPYYASHNVEDEFGKFSTLVTRCTVKAKVIYDAVKTIHPMMAEYCLEELTTSYNVSRAELTNLLLSNDKFFVCVQGKDELMKYIHRMLVKRRCVRGEQNKFSPLIEAIIKERSGAEETVLHNAVKRLDKDAIMCQLLARYHYIKKKDFKLAKDWAKKAKDLSQGNSYIFDTAAQVIKHELKSALASANNPITPEMLKEYLKMAGSATDAFKETQETAKKEVSLYQIKRGNSPFNTAGYLGEIQVGVMILEVLKRTPIFSAGDPVRHDIMKMFLSGKMKIQDISKKDTVHAPYYDILHEFSDLLCNLRCNMKKQFDFLDCFFVNLGPKLSLSDCRGQSTQEELRRCFHFYVELFCKFDVSSLPKESMRFQIHKKRKFLESMQADTHSGLLKCISENISGENVEEIVRTYEFILSNSQSEKKPVKDRVNFIYAIVALHCIKPDSDVLPSFQTLLRELCGILKDPILPRESLALHFIAIALLWPSQKCSPDVPEFSKQLGSYASQMSRDYWDQMGPVCHSKWPISHLYLGKKKGYNQLIHHNKIVSSVDSEEAITSLWGNGTIWKQEKVQDLLYRAQGKVLKDTILLETEQGVKIEVKPYYKSQIRGGRGNSRVSFFIGFTMKGPLAFDIQFQ